MGRPMDRPRRRPRHPEEEMNDTKTYEFVSNGQRYRIEVPADYRVTYGQVTPGAKSGGGGYALRIYENSSKESTRAIFTEVTSFRDLSLPLKVEAIRKFGSTEWRHHRSALDEGEIDWKNIDELTTTPPPAETDEAKARSGWTVLEPRKSRTTASGAEF